MWIGLRPNWTAYTMSGTVKLDEANYANGGFNVHIQTLPNPAPNDSGLMYWAGILWTGGSQGSVIIGAEAGGSTGLWNQLAQTPVTFLQPGTDYLLEVAVSGSTVKVSVDHVQYTVFTDSSYDLTFGSVGIRTYNSTMTFGPVTIACN
jgi:hypothetical protein